MGLNIGKIAASLIPGVGPAIAGADAKEAAKAQKEGAQEGAQFKYKQTLAQAQFDKKTTLARTDLEQQAAVESATIERRQTQEDIALASAKLGAQIDAERATSAIRQTDMARKKTFDIASLRTRAIGSGVAYTGTARDVVTQAATLAELDRLNLDYESRLGVRGMLFDRVGLMLKSGQANEAAEFTIRQTTAAADLTREQVRESFDLTKKYAAESKALELKYAQIGYRTERNQIDTQTAINIAGSVLGSAAAGANIYQQATGQSVFKLAFG
jgi:hypothetical protein